MQNYVLSITRLAWVLPVVGLLCTPEMLQAYPPAPPHEIYGKLRGEDGEPLFGESVRIVLETDQGLRVDGNTSSNLEPGVNYRLKLPMDSGITPDTYLFNALLPGSPFLISVIIGTTTYLPIEMLGDFRLLGEPGASTRLDLTLGEDSDGDGLPDGWEEQVIALLGGGLGLADITPGGDADNDGLSNYAEYIAGTYAFDDQDAFELFPGETDKPDTLAFEFLAISGRAYQIEGSTNLREWAPVRFVVPEESSEEISFYSASDVRILSIEVPSTGGVRAYRGTVQ